jgi:predicted nuclease of restriction endonuclease-like (RecB) superfamily
LIEFYWDLGEEIIEMQTTYDWGTSFLKSLSSDMISEFPDAKGFSYSNLRYIRQWYLFYINELGNWQQLVANLDKISSLNIFEIGQQPVGQFQIIQDQTTPTIRQQHVIQLKNLISQIPWGHNILIVSKSENIEEALFYINKTIENGWSRSVLTHQIESGIYKRSGKAISNFANTLPAVQSDLAQQIIKDPYNFDFLSMRDRYNERELENNLIEHISSFLLELGAGFAYVGKQVHLEVGGRDFYLDLLFYHIKLHCYVVVELKIEEFEPEHTGKLNFYIKAVDEKFKTERDEPTIGILICKKRNKMIAEYALHNMQAPMGISEYELTQILPDNLKSGLPTIEEIEAELEGKRL